jgi:TPP-dependent pyruvate/acetoin dehydrogenase alpha subunit
MKFKSIEEELFFNSLRIRLVEEKIAEIYPSDKIQSPVHLSIGQEAVATGSCHSLRQNDLLFANYRSHAFYLAKGGDLKKMMAELYGKVTGTGRGKAGSMHLFDPDCGMMVSSAVVASTIPHAVGAALAAKTKKTQQIILSVFGDGATEEGVFHESLNFAALKNLPILFLCENNGLAIHSSTSARQSYKITDLAKAYGISTFRCDEGYDYLSVYNLFRKCAVKVRESESPCFIEIVTFRYREHVGPGEDFRAGYRSSKDWELWKKKDPLCLKKAWIKKYTPEILEEIEEAVAFAESSPWPEKEELLADVS